MTEEQKQKEHTDPLGFELAMLVPLASVERLGALVVRQIETLAPATDQTPRQIARGLLNVTGTEIEDWEAVADGAGEPTWAAIAEYVLGEIEHDGPLDRIDKFLPGVCRAIVAGNRERLVAALAGAVSDAVRRRLRPFDDEPEQSASDETEPDDERPDEPLPNSEEPEAREFFAAVEEARNLIVEGANPAFARAAAHRLREVTDRHLSIVRNIIDGLLDAARLTLVEPEQPDEPTA